MANTEEKSGKTSTYVNELWSTFEKTGSVSAYLLYNVVRESSEKESKSVEKNNTLQK
jgi:hypothetical protein